MNSSPYFQGPATPALIAKAAEFHLPRSTGEFGAMYSANPEAFCLYVDWTRWHPCCEEVEPEDCAPSLHDYLHQTGLLPAASRERPSTG